MRMPVPGSPVGWYWTNSMSFSGTPSRYASAMPSPVLMLPLVVKGQTLPPPPVQRITERPSTAFISPVRTSRAATPPHCPFSIRSFVTKCSSSRTMLSYFIDVWNSVCSMWKPILSVAYHVRLVVMPPKARVATVPSSFRLNGQPQRSSCESSLGASSTKYWMTS